MSLKRLNNEKREIYISNFCFYLWGTWSYFINIKDENRFISSFFQGIASFFITIFMVRLIIVFNRLFINSSFYIVAILTVIITSSIVFIGHLLINTQNIFYTIAPTVVVSLLFSVFMAKKVSKIS